MKPASALPPRTRLGGNRCERRVRLAGALCILFALSACSTPELVRNVEQGMQVANEWPEFSDADEERMARANARAFEDSASLWDDALLEAYLTEMTQGIVSVADPRPFDYTVRIVDSPVVNAFTFGGGYVYVNAGLIARMENEAQLAMVLGHEVAHVTEGHVAEGIEAAYGLQVLGQVAAQGAQATGTLEGPALEKTYEYALSAAVNGHGRGREAEADRVALRYMADAGYDPRQAPETFRVLFEEHGDPEPIEHFFWGSHPTNRSRQQTLAKLVETEYADRLSDPDLVVNSERFQRSARRLFVAMGIDAYEAKRFGTARAMFEKAAPISTEDPVPHYYLGRLALETGGADAVADAIPHLDRAIEIDPEFARAYVQLGLARWRDDDVTEAIAALERCLEVAPDSEAARRAEEMIEELRGSR